MNKPSEFDKKLQHSIELLQKSEKLALLYDNADGFYLAFSGGKDSQALYHVAEMSGVKFKAHMSFTSVDPPQVIRFVRTQYPDVVTHKPQWSIFDRAVQRGILPSMRIRWCCADFKETAGAGKVTLIGIRKYESVRRSKRHEVEVSNRKFSGSLEEFGEWQAKELERSEAKLIRKMKREGKKVNEDEFSLQKDNEIRCINGKDSILVSPIFEWSEQDVWYFLNEVVKVPHCELYDQGYRRIGCILCPMSQYKQKEREMKDFPHVKRNWIKAIKAIRRGDTIIKTKKHSLAEWARQTRTFNGNMQFFRNSNITHFQDIRGAKTLEQESQHSDFGWIQCPDKAHWTFLGGSVEGREPTEDEIAENIFDWWVSGKSYSRWYAEKFLQQKIEFGFDEPTH